MITKLEFDLENSILLYLQDLHSIKTIILKIHKKYFHWWFIQFRWDIKCTEPSLVFALLLMIGIEWDQFACVREELHLPWRTFKAINYLTCVSDLIIRDTDSIRHCKHYNAVSLYSSTIRDMQ